MKEKWNERYSAPEFIYGTEPNEFFKRQLNKLTYGRLLLPGEGEGRNAVYAAKLGWKVDAFDFSEAAKRKAQYLAESKNVTIQYTIASYTEFLFPPKKYDAIGLLYAHMPSMVRSTIHKKVIESLKPNGNVIFEAFHKDQLNYSSGGPKDPDMLYNEDELAEDFKELNIILLEKQKIHLAEGTFHKGDAVVVRMSGKIAS